jgi:hypothetical protein
MSPRRGASSRRLARLVRRALPLAALAVALGLTAPAALADGDPASDYLLSGPSFLSPYDGHIPAAEQNRINTLLAAVKAKGFPLRLAVIATPYDLGSVPILFGKPQLYAKFLGEEDYYYWKDELLVVMPNGYGIFKANNLPAADRAAIAALPKIATSKGAALGLAAETALHALAATHKIALGAVARTSSAGSSSAWTDRAEIAGGALVLAGLGFAAYVLLRRRAHR